MTAEQSPASSHFRSPCAVVLGGWVSGYSIISELHAEGVEHIALLDNERRLGAFSNKVETFRRTENSAEALSGALLELRQQYDYLVLFPTKDIQLEHMLEVQAEIGDFCFMPFNPTNLLDCLEKRFQYAACERLGVPYPRSITVSRIEDYERLREIPFPILLKPNKRDDLDIHSLSRNIQLPDEAAHGRHRSYVADHLSLGVQFIASEVVPGDGSQIYAYTAFRSPEGRIVNEWIGKKLSQHPDDFGVFASASNQAPDVVRDQGRTLLEQLDIHGIAEPEFKFDHRDGRYKLMEINLRSMMWNHVGYLSGVPLHYSMYRYATGAEPLHRVQDQQRDIHFIFFSNEINNLVSRKGYAGTFRSVFRGGDERVLAIWDRKDPLPFLASLRILSIELAKKAAKACLRLLRIR